MEYEIMCPKCDWEGYYGELWCNPEDEEKPVNQARFNVCPNSEEVSEFEILDRVED